eukprot:13509631-Heterocapsa_arctica.AAC.1
MSFVITTWDPDRQRHAFMPAVTQLFGSNTAPLNFTRIPDFCTYAASFLMFIPFVHCVDDMLSAERCVTADSAYSSWRFLAAACGWNIPDD